MHTSSIDQSIIEAVALVKDEVYYLTVTPRGLGGSTRLAATAEALTALLHAKELGYE